MKLKSKNCSKFEFLIIKMKFYKNKYNVVKNYSSDKLYFLSIY